jgi:hypothetical protein
MIESERDLLMPFLRKLQGSRKTPDDAAANTLIQRAVRTQPNASYLLVQRALALECQLATAQRRINELEGRQPEPARGLATCDFLNLQTAHWGEGAQRGERTASATSGKLFYDMVIKPWSVKFKDPESRIVFFIGNHTGQIWLGIFAIAAMVVLLKEKLV